MVCNTINNNILEAICDTLINKGYTKSAGLLKICMLYVLIKSTDCEAEAIAMLFELTYGIP